jgi:hypothetical protein
MVQSEPTSQTRMKNPPAFPISVNLAGAVQEVADKFKKSIEAGKKGSKIIFFNFLACILLILYNINGYEYVF